MHNLLHMHKTIINKALSGKGPFQFYGFPLDQMTYLFTLCGYFLVLVLIGGVLKYVTNVYVGVVSERMLRRLRFHDLRHTTATLLLRER